MQIKPWRSYDFERNQEEGGKKRERITSPGPLYRACQDAFFYPCGISERPCRRCYCVCAERKVEFSYSRRIL